MNKIILLIGLFLLAGCNAPKEVAGDGRSLDFTADWAFRLGDDTAASRPDYNDADWRKLNLPHDWAIEGEFSKDNPSGTGGGALPGGIGWYRKTFTADKADEGKRYRIDFDGAYMNSTVYINGHELGTRPYGYISFSYDLTPYIKWGEENVLAVRVDNAEQPNSRWYSGCGIYRNVWLTKLNPAHIAQWGTYVTAEDVSKNSAQLKIRTKLQYDAEAQMADVVLQSRLVDADGNAVGEAVSEAQLMPLTPAEVEQEIHLKNPRLWWCHNMGKPEMYGMDLAFEIDGKVSDKETINFGVREVRDYFTEEGYRGFLLNGKKVLVRSAGWTDDIFLRDTPASNEIQVQYVRDMNLNSIRFENIWGTSQNVYDLCDRYGLLVLVGWSCHWEWDNYLGSSCDEFGGIKSEKDMNLIARSLNDQVLWLRNHPAIIAWFVGSDMIPRPELEKRYKAYLSQIDDRPYIGAAKELTSTVTGPTGMKMEGPYDYVAPNYWYSEKAPGGAFGFNTETGIGAQLPVIESIRRMIPADKLWPVGKEWDYHCTVSDAAMNSLEVLKENMATRYGEAKDLDDFLRKADWLNYEGTRTMFEAFRVNIPRTTGIVQWMLNSAWPSLYWQLYDYYLIPTAAYYSVKKSNMPQQLIYHYGKNAVYAVNESAGTVQMQGVMSLYDCNSRVVTQQTTTLEIAPYTVVKAFDVPAVKENTFLYLKLNDEKGAYVGDNFYWLAAAPDVNDWANTDWVRTPIKKSADFTGLANLSQVNCEVSATVEQEENDVIVEVALENDPNALAFFIRLSLKDEKDELLYPVFWEDNYLSLIPGEKRTLKCVVPQQVAEVESVTLTVSGWNVPEKKIKLFLDGMK